MDEVCFVLFANANALALTGRLLDTRTCTGISKWIQAQVENWFVWFPEMFLCHVVHTQLFS